jgi:hypothetical protein
MAALNKAEYLLLPNGVPQAAARPSALQSYLSGRSFPSIQRGEEKISDRKPSQAPQAHSKHLFDSPNEAGEVLPVRPPNKQEQAGKRVAVSKYMQAFLAERNETGPLSDQIRMGRGLDSLCFLSVAIDP